MFADNAILFQNIGYAIVALMVVSTIYMLVSPLLEGDKLKRRMSSVSTARDQLKQRRLDQLNQEQKGLRSETKNSIRKVVDSLSLAKLLEASNLRDKLAQAGLRGEKPVYTFYIFRLFLPLGLGFLGFVLFLVLNVMNWSEFTQRITGFIGMLALGYYAPAIYLNSRAKKRLAAIMPVFPDALDLLLICVESGMSIEVAFARVAEEMAENSVELAEEFSLTNAELSYLQSRRQAYENLSRRNNHVGIRSVATALIQSERYGTPLGSTLRTLANENRQMRVLAAEKKAAALPAKLTVPMIVFFLPVLFIVILTPAVLRIGEAF